MKKVEVVVIGGGCVGLCCAIALADRGVRVTLFERGLAGAANSTMTGGGIRQQFGTEINVRLSLLAAAWWDGFAARFGVDPLFRPIGYLFLARSGAEAAMLRSHVALQNGLGVDSEYLDGEEVARRWPALDGRGLVSGGFRQGDGWANQHRVIDGMLRGALAARVDVRVGTEVLAIERSGGRAAGLTTTAGPVAADAVVVATGPWISALLGPLAIDVPVVGRRHELLIVEPAEPLPPALPWLIGVGDEVHLRSDAEGRALVGGFLGHDEAADPDGYATRADPEWTRRVLETAGRVFGVVDHRARVRHGWAGLYPGTPDRHPIIDRLADGIYGVLGFSGTGLMHAPAAGILAAELVVDGGLRSMDAAPLSASRFNGQAAASETTGF